MMKILDVGPNMEKGKEREEFFMVRSKEPKLLFGSGSARSKVRIIPDLDLIRICELYRNLFVLT